MAAMRTTTKIVRFEDHEGFRQESERLQHLHAHLAAAEAAGREATTRTEALRAQAADAELRAALHEGRDPELQRLYAELEKAEEDSEGADRRAQALRIAIGRQRETTDAVREQARRMVVADAAARWAVLLGQLVEFVPSGAEIQQALALAMEARGGGYDRRQGGWTLSAAELARLRSWTEEAWELLRGAGFDV